MRILTWNINGIRTLPQYHPWNSLKTGDKILDELKADIVCFQEMKIQRSSLQQTFAVTSQYDSFFSFPAMKGGYSGVAVYTKRETVAPSKAEEGLTGKLQPKTPFSPSERISTTYPQVHDIDLFANEDGTVPSDLTELDMEGRALVLDFRLFVLINVYCPAETSETRLPYKMNFHLLLQERVRRLIHDEGREVIVIGDINVTAAPIDHCDGNLPSQQADFWGRPPRAWLRNWLVPLGPMMDVIRDEWPDRKGMYTCWNTMISARESNYGTRVDYILLTKGLIPWFKHGDIQPSIKGSDHCPVYIDLHDEIQLDSGETLKIQDAMEFTQSALQSPRISASHWDEFKQRLLSTFFLTKTQIQRKTSMTASEESPSSCLSGPPNPSHDAKAETVATTGAESPHIDTPIMDIMDSDLSKPLISTSSQGDSNTTKKSKWTGDDESGPKKKKQKLKAGQAKISSFFSKGRGAAAPSSDSTPCQSQSDQSVSNLDNEGDREQVSSLDDPWRQIEADHKFAMSLVTAESEDSRASSSQNNKAVWNQLFAPRQPPKCKVHGEPCKEFTVNKAGPNKGKTFFICARPVGPGYDKGKKERLREEVDVQYRCNFFKWGSAVKNGDNH
ncbi:DNase I-like protein [Hysterangium stoloniferum]|nr:DNase I-like protein [Hysterangium stoloniferum]